MILVKKRTTRALDIAGYGRVWFGTVNVTSVGPQFEEARAHAPQSSLKKMGKAISVTLPGLVDISESMKRQFQTEDGTFEVKIGSGCT